MKESHLRKIQKQRHMSNILIMILNNPIFKNLSDKDRYKMAKLIYKAEMIEMHARDKDIVRVNTSFQNIIDSIRINLEQMDEKDMRDFLDDDFDDDQDSDFR